MEVTVVAILDNVAVVWVVAIVAGLADVALAKDGVNVLRVLNSLVAAKDIAANSITSSDTTRPVKLVVSPVCGLRRWPPASTAVSSVARSRTMRERNTAVG